MLNSLNNKYLTVPEFFGIGSAQIKILKNSNNHDPLSPNGPSTVSSLATRAQTLLNNSASPKGERQLGSVNTANLSKDNIKSELLLRSSNTNFNLFNPQIKKIAIKYLQPLKSVDVHHIHSTGAGAISNQPVLHKDIDPKQAYLELRLADNKRFLFLYFILPIFFGTLKNSNPIRAKNLKNQIKQLHSLIKLMLDSGSSIHSQLEHNRSSKLNSFSKLPFTANLKSAQFTISAEGEEDINYLIESLLPLQSTRTIDKKWPQSHTNIFKTSTKCAEHVPANVVIKFASDLLKWSVLFIAQSLAPLKRKHDYYSLIFIKILEARGFFSKDKKTNLFSSAVPALGQGGEENLISDTHLTLVSKSKSLQKPVLAKTRKIHTTEKDSLMLPVKPVSELVFQNLQNKISLTNKNVPVALAQTDLNTNKKASITYYPGGRYISD